MTHLTPPAKKLESFDLQAEVAVIGSVLLDQRRLLLPAVAGLKSHQFFDEAHQRVWGMICDQHATGKPLDLQVIANRLKDQPGEKLDEHFLTTLINGAGTGYAAEHFAEVVREHAQRRRLLQVASEIEREVTSGLPPDDIDGVLTRYLEYRREKDTGFAANGFTLLTCLDVANAPEPEYLARGLIPRGQPGVVGAPYKGMKTSICCDIATALATGGYVLGFFKVPRPVRVLFMSAESGLPTLRKTTESICTAAGVRWPDDLENLQWCTTLPKLGVDDDLRKLDAAFAVFPFEVLIVDPLFKMCGGDGAENVMKQGEKFMHLQRWCDDRGVTLIYVHHLTKPASKVYEPAELGDLTYAGIAENVRWWILLSRQEKYLPPDPVHKLWFSAGGSAGHSGLWALNIDLGEYVEGMPRQWEVSLQEAQEVRQVAAEKKAAEKNAAKLTAAQAKAQENVTSLLKTLKNFPDGETKTVLRTRSGLHTSALDCAIYDALEANQIEPCTVFKGGRKKGRDGYKLAASGASGASGKNAACPDAPNAKSIGEGKPLLKEGFPVPMLSGALVNDSEQTIGETEAA